MLKLIGFVPSGAKTTSFCIPVYSCDGEKFFTHILDKEANMIIGFSETTLPGYEENIPKLMQKEVKEGDKSLFVIIEKNLLFVGNKDEVSIFFKTNPQIGGKHFKKELEELMSY